MYIIYGLLFGSFEALICIYFRAIIIIIFDHQITRACLALWRKWRNSDKVVVSREPVCLSTGSGRDRDEANSVVNLASVFDLELLQRVISKNTNYMLATLFFLFVTLDTYVRLCYPCASDRKR